MKTHKYLDFWILVFSFTLHSPNSLDVSLVLTDAVVIFMPSRQLVYGANVLVPTPLKMRCGQAHCYLEAAESDCTIAKQEAGLKSKAQCFSCYSKDV